MENFFDSDVLFSPLQETTFATAQPARQPSHPLPIRFLKCFSPRPIFEIGYYFRKLLIKAFPRRPPPTYVSAPPTSYAFCELNNYVGENKYYLPLKKEKKTLIEMSAKF